MNIFVAVTACVAAGCFGAAGVGRIAKVESMVRTRERLGLPVGQWTIIGVFELLGAVGLMAGLHSDLPVVGVLAATGLVALTIGATYYHQRAGDPMRVWLVAVALGSLAVFYAVLRIGTASSGRF